MNNHTQPPTPPPLHLFVNPKPASLLGKTGLPPHFDPKITLRTAVAGWLIAALGTSQAKVPDDVQAGVISIAGFAVGAVYDIAAAWLKARLSPPTRHKTPHAASEAQGER